MSFNLAVILARARAAAPDKAVAVFDGGQLTYGELDGLSDRLAASLAAAGMRPGDAVALQLPNIPQFLIAYFGILKAGGVVVPLNVLLKAPEVAYYLGDSGAKILITWEGVLGEAAKGAEAAGVGEIYAVGHAGERRRARMPFEQLLAGAATAPGWPPRKLTDTAVIVYTSGTTGRPKGAELTHIQLYMNADIPGRLFDVAARRRRHHGPAAVPRVRPVQHPERLRAVRLHDVAHPAVRSRRGPGRDPARPGHHLRGRAHHVHRPAALPGPGQLRPVLAAGRDLRRRVDTRAGPGRLRGALRRGHPGGLRADRDRVHHDLQHERDRTPGLQRRQAHLGDADAGLGRARATPCRPARTTWARWSPAGCTS